MGAYNKDEAQKYFWEKAGKIGYGKAIFSHQMIEDHIMSRHWKTAIEISESLGVNKNSKVLELGCGDGKFAEQVLSARFKFVDALDRSESAIRRAKKQSKSKNVNFRIEDITSYRFDPDGYWECAFLMGFLHHVKPFATQIISRISEKCPCIIVVEPNGDNIIRKFLEFLPTYRAAGEQSFKLKELAEIFERNGYRIKALRRKTIIPPFLPKMLLMPFKRMEEVIESFPAINNLCSTNLIGFKK